MPVKLIKGGGMMTHVTTVGANPLLNARPITYIDPSRHSLNMFTGS